MINKILDLTFRANRDAEAPAVDYHVMGDRRAAVGTWPPFSCQRMSGPCLQMPVRAVVRHFRL